MRTWTEEHREGTNVGPVDWNHSTARDMPRIWRDAEKNIDGYLFNGRPIVQICMYDGWPYWCPRPAVMFIGPLNSGEWTFFDSYGVSAESISAKQ